MLSAVTGLEAMGLLTKVGGTAGLIHMCTGVHLHEVLGLGAMGLLTKVGGAWVTGAYTARHGSYYTHLVHGHVHTAWRTVSLKAMGLKITQLSCQNRELAHS